MINRFSSKYSVGKKILVVRKKFDVIKNFDLWTGFSLKYSLPLWLLGKKPVLQELNILRIEKATLFEKCGLLNENKNVKNPFLWKYSSQVYFYKDLNFFLSNWLGSEKNFSYVWLFCLILNTCNWPTPISKNIQFIIGR